MRPTVFNENSYIHRFHSDEKGSISLLIIGFFLVALTSVMVVTDVAVVANAKKSLDLATETAALSAVHNLDLKNYYAGKHTILTSTRELINGGNYADNRIPVDCERGLQNAEAELKSWISSKDSTKTTQIESYQIKSYQCIYDVVHISTSAEVKLPFPAPFSKFDKVMVNSSISTKNLKDRGLYLFGIRIN